MKVSINLSVSILGVLLSTNAFAYSTKVAFKPAVSNEYPSVQAKVVVHCGLGSKQKNEQPMDTSKVTDMGPSSCNGVFKRESTDLYIDTLPVLADWQASDGSDNFCITALKPNQFVSGYRADKKFANPCDAPDPVKRREPIADLLDNPVLLTQTFAPKVYLHPDELFFPMHTKPYIEKSSLRLGKKNIIIPEGDLDERRLLEHGSYEHIVHHDDKKGELDSVKCYAFPRFTQDRQAVDISYWLFYPFNGAPEILGRPYNPESGIGAHFGDWEHITVRLTADAEHIIGIHYAAHGKDEGTWQWGQVNNPEKAYMKGDAKHMRYSGYVLDAQTFQPIAFSSKFTHAMYNRAGTIQREITYGLSNDKTGFGALINCAAPGTLMLVTDPVLDSPRLLEADEQTLANSQFLSFTGVYGVDGSRSPSGKPIWMDEVE